LSQAWRNYGCAQEKKDGQEESHEEKNSPQNREKKKKTACERSQYEKERHLRRKLPRIDPI